MPPVTMLERPQLVAQQLLAGQPASAWNAMLQPQELTPAEHDAYLKKLGIKGTVYEQVFKTITNPLLIVSLILSHKFPPAVGDNLLKLSQKVGGLGTRIPFLGKMLSKDAWFRGTPIPGLLDDVAMENMDFKKRFGVILGEELDKVKRVGGAGLTDREGIMVAAYVDGLHTPMRGFSGKKGTMRIGSGSTQVDIPDIGVLMPGLREKMSPQLQELADGVREKMLNEQWKINYGKPEHRKRILSALKKQRDAGLWDDNAEDVLAFMENPVMRPNYFPHRIERGPEDFQAMVEKMTASGASKRYSQAAGKKADSWISDEFRKRKFAMTPSWKDLEQVKDLVDPAAFQRLEAMHKAKLLQAARIGGVRESIIAKMQKLSFQDIRANYPRHLAPGEARIVADAIETSVPKEYSLKLVPVLTQYTHTMAGTYAWTVRGYGEKLTAAGMELKALAAKGNPHAQARYDYFEKALIPLSMGRLTFQRAVKAQAWHQGMAALQAKLDNPTLKNLIGEDLHKSLLDMVSPLGPAGSLTQVEGKVSTYFYLSTLGVNPGSAVRNLFQNVLTLGPTLGWVTAAKAGFNVMSQTNKYMALRFGPRALSHENAVAKVFPNFAKAGLAAGHITEEVVSEALRAASHSVSILPQGMMTVGEKVKRGMMALFTGSETINRLMSFEAGMIHAKRAGLHIDVAIPFAREIVRKTQFSLTPTSGPMGLLNSGSTVKQFLYFPAKMLEFATSTALTLGGGAIDPRTGKMANISGWLGRDVPIIGGFNPGTAARMVAGSIIAMELGDAMGMDFRSGLLESSLPLAQEVRTGSPWGALPVIPPAIGVAGALAYGASTGDWKALKHSAPLLIPGGVTAARSMGLLPSQMGASAARVLDRTYADYEQPAPDGRIAVYSGKGTFRGFYTPWDLIKTGLGVGGGDLSKEQELLTLVTKNRDAISQSKRDYADARFRNSAREANGIAVSFKQKFGFDLPITEKDMKAMQTRRHVTRLEQLLRTAPAGPARESLIAAVQTAMAGSAEAMLGVDPALLGQSRSKAEKSRFGSGSSTRQPFRARSDMSPFDSVNPRTIGRSPGIDQLQAIP